MYIDTHTHLNATQLIDDIENVVRRAVEANVEIMMMPNVDASSYDQMMDIYRKWPNHCLPMIGIHPTSVTPNYLEQLEWVYREIEKNDFYAIGEIGIDLYWDTSLRSEQEACFSAQIALAGQRQLPVNIHSRESIDLCIEHIEEGKRKHPGLTGIFHCFTGTTEQAERIQNIGGFLMGIGGVLTFKNSTLKTVVQQIPIDYIVLETDAPYLTPHPYRGKRNEPSYIPLIAQSLAEAKGMSLKDVQSITTANAHNVYKLDTGQA